MNATVDRGSRGLECVGPAAGACVFCVVKISCPSQVLLWCRHNKTQPHLSFFFVFAVDACERVVFARPHWKKSCTDEDKKAPTFANGHRSYRVRRP